MLIDDGSGGGADSRRGRTGSAGSARRPAGGGGGTNGSLIAGTTVVSYHSAHSGTDSPGPGGAAQQAVALENMLLKARPACSPLPSVCRRTSFLAGCVWCEQERLQALEQQLAQLRAQQHGGAGAAASASGGTAGTFAQLEGIRESGSDEL